MHITCTCPARDVAVKVEAQPLMQTVFRSARPLSYWRVQLRSAVQLPSSQPVLLKPVCALAQSQTRPIPRSSHFRSPSSLRCAHASAFGSIPRAVSVDHMHTNRLASEESPYLLQHQQNPVRSAGLQLHQSAAVLLMLGHTRVQYMAVQGGAVLQVDWYPWGKEAFEKALAEDKPIFLSVGYSTCHW